MDAYIPRCYLVSRSDHLLLHCEEARYQVNLRVADDCFVPRPFFAIPLVLVAVPEKR